MSIEVNWTEPAASDLDKILEYISIHDGPTSALMILDRIKAAAVKLEHLPSRGRIVPELREFGILDYRELIAGPWRIVYRVEENSVIVHAVLDARRDLLDILLDRFAF